MLSTLGMPTRSCERSLGWRLVPAEAFLANHVCNVGKRILRLLDSGLDNLHFVQVFHEPLRTRIVHDDALPARREWNLAPCPSLALEQFHVNEAALAVHRAPVAPGRGPRRGLVGESFNRVEALELCPPAILPPVKRDQARADGSSFARVRMDYHFRIR